MYVDHNRYEKPEDQDEIWRYMDFTKFVCMLNSSSLYFCRLDCLTANDPFEGSFYNSKMFSTLMKDGVPEELLKQGTERYFNSWRRKVAVNCWHISDIESAALWKIYLKSNEGIVVRSTFESLVKAISGCPEYIYIWKVKYCDSFGEDRTCSATDAFVHKRRSFEHERELRAMIFKEGIEKVTTGSEFEQRGIEVKVDIDVLIKEVIVNPEGPDWIRDLVEAVSRKYGIETKVRNSSLYNAPPFG